MLNAVSSFRRNSLKPNTKYRAIVIDNDDSKEKHPYLGRVRVKIPKLVDFDKPEDHPWAIPDWDHPDGLTEFSGKFDVPKVNSYVDVWFQEAPDGTASVEHPVYSTTNLTTPTANKNKEHQHHYPDRKLYALSNGTRVIIDTKDDSVWLYNPGETHCRSNGKLVIKCEESFVIISDVEVGIRAPSLHMMAKDEFIMESEGTMVLRSKGKMSFESRDDIRMRARMNVEIDTEEESIKLTTLSEKGGTGNIELTAKKDRIKITTEGGGGRTSHVEILSKMQDVTIESTKQTVFLTAKAKNIDLTARQNVLVVASKNVEVKASTDVNLRAGKTANMKAGASFFIKAPSGDIDVG